MLTQERCAAKVPHMPNVDTILAAKEIIKAVQGRGSEQLKALIHLVKMPNRPECSLGRLQITQEELDRVSGVVLDEQRKLGIDRETLELALRQQISFQKL